MKKIFAIIITFVTAMTNSCVSFASQFGDELEKGVTNYSNQIDVSKYNYSQADAQNEFTYLVSRSENAWYINRSAKFKMNGNKVDKIIVSYKYNQKQIKEKRDFIENTVNSIVKQAQQYTTDYDKAKFVYDYLIDTYDYDWSLNNASDLELYENGTGVCRAFAIAYRNILTKLDIPCDVVISSAMKHEWNVVQINGKWYNVDCSGADLLDSDRDCFFLKSDLFFTFLGYYNGISYSNEKAENIDLD